MTLYAVSADYNPHDDADGSVSTTIEPYEKGWYVLEDAIDLWRLVSPSRAAAMEGLLDEAKSAGRRLYPLFRPATVQRLVEVLVGLEEALRGGGVIDDQWLIPAESAADLAAKVPSMDVSGERTFRELQSSLAEVLIRVRSVRLFLEDALAEGRAVVFG